MWRSSRLTLAIICTSALLHSQQAPSSSPGPTQQKSEPAVKLKPLTVEEKWLYPAQRISADLESQFWRAKRELHAVGIATLGSYWWKQDRTAAEHWIYPAVDELTFASQLESGEERGARLQSMRRVLAVVSPLDAVLRDRLRDTLRASSRVGHDDVIGPLAQMNTADAVLNAVPDESPNELARAISEALRYAVTPSIIYAIENLHDDLPDEAEHLFSDALAKAAATPNAVELRWFGSVLEDTSGSVPDTWKDAVAREFQRVLGDGSMDRKTRCMAATELGARTDWLGGQYAPLITTVGDGCNGAGGFTKELAADSNAISQRDPHTVEEYLAAADEVRTSTARYQLKITAAETADEAGQSIRALRIMDDFKPDERAVNPSEWKLRRSDIAVHATVQAIRQNNCSSGVSIVETSPRLTMFHVAVGVAEQIGKSDCYKQLIEIALRQMRAPVEDPNDFIRLLNMVVSRGPVRKINVTAILREMDAWPERDPKRLPRGELAIAATWNSLESLDIDEHLFDIPPEDLTAIARGFFRNELLRADFELFVVQGFLARYARESQKRTMQSSVAEK